MVLLHIRRIWTVEIYTAPVGPLHCDSKSNAHKHVALIDQYQKTGAQSTGHPIHNQKHIFWQNPISAKMAKKSTFLQQVSLK